MFKEVLFKNRTLLLLWLEQISSSLGGLFAVFIKSILIYQITGSLLMMSNLLLAYSIPSILINLFSGPYIDKYSKKKLMFISVLARCLVFALPMIMYFNNSLEPWHLLFASLVTGVADSIFRISIMAYIPDIIEKGLLIKVNSLFEGTNKLVWVITPVCAGMLLDTVGAGFILISMVALLLISNAFLMLIPTDHSIESNNLNGESYFSQLKQGFQFFAINPILIGVSIIVIITNLGNGALQPLFMPYIIDVLNGTNFEYGLFISSYSCGMLLGAFILGNIKLNNNKLIIIVSTFMIGLFTALLGFSFNFIVSVIFAILIGANIMGFGIVTTTLYQHIVPKELRGRVFALRRLISECSSPIGISLGGILGAAIGIKAVFIVVGIITLFTAIIAWRVPVFSLLNKQEEINVERGGL